MKVVKTIYIYLANKRAAKTIDVVQYDTGIQLVFSLEDFTFPLGTTGTLYVQKPSGKFVYQEDGITTSDVAGTITIDLDNQAITEHGKVLYQVTLKNGADEITSFTGVMMVQKSLKDSGATESTTVIRAFDNAVSERIAKFQTEAEKIASAVIATIPEDYTAMEAKVNELANAIKGTLSGAVVFADDVSPVEHIASVKVYGKNLCSMTAFNSMSSNGASNTYDASTHIITMGADTAPNNFTGRYCRPLGYNFKVGTEYTISFEVKGTAGKKVSCGWDTGRIDITLTDEFVRYGTTKRATREDEVVSFYSITTEKGGLASGEYMQFANVQIEVGNEMTDFMEYIEPSTATVRRCGKNLCPSMETGKTATISGMTFTGKENGGIGLNGTPTAIARYALYNDKAIAKSGFITLSLAGTFSNVIWDFQILDAENNIIKHIQTSDATTINLDSYPDAVYWSVGIKRLTDNVPVSGVVYPQIEVGLVATAYEAYNSKEYIPSSDGTVEGVTSLSPNMTILTDTEGMIVECEYNKDTNKVIQKICDALGIEI